METWNFKRFVMLKKFLRINGKYGRNSFRHIKRTAIGLDSIPYTVWKGDAELFALVLTKVWNISFKTYTWPVSWKRFNIKPQSKVKMPKENSDYGGIDISPVLERAFRGLFAVSMRTIVLNVTWGHASWRTERVVVVLMLW